MTDRSLQASELMTPHLHGRQDPAQEDHRSSFVPRSIAIVGMACEFPGAHSPGELWENVLAGRRYFRKAPKERLPAEYFDPDPTTPGTSYIDQMAVLDGWCFDPLEFHIPPVTFEASDMAHWLTLYVARAAIRDACLDLQGVDRGRIGVGLGNTLTGEFSRSHNMRHRWPYTEKSIRRVLDRGGLSADQASILLAAIRESYEAPLPEITEDSLAGNMSNTIAGRVCPPAEACYIGSIKAQIGHCKAAAGAAGLIKAIMALKRKVLPPTANCVRPSPAFGQPLGVLRPAIVGKPWQVSTGPRRASVSAIGFGGANAHVTLEEANPGDGPLDADFALLGSSQPSELILLSAATPEDLLHRLDQLIPIADRICRAELTDLAAALAAPCRPQRCALR
jgi:acyl transferase domain-containing protein